MNLDLVPLGWIHTLACLAALAFGAWVLATPKGTPAHRRVGRWYLIAQLVLNLTALGVYRLGVFFFPHVLAIITLGLIAIGWLAARFHQPGGLWKHAHLSAMILSYYMLIGGGVNEVYLRIDALRAYVSVNGGRVIGETHALVMLTFLILLLAWNAVEIGRGVLRRRRRAGRLATD
jgi:uncharacterized membrane protein